MYKRWIYCSEALQPFNEEQLKALEEQSATFNNAVSISGILSYWDNHFIQYLEGEEKHLDDLINKIKIDPRHRIQKIMALDQNDEKLFTDWGMKIFLPTDVEAVIPQYIIFLLTMVQSSELLEPETDPLIIKNLILLSEVAQGTDKKARRPLNF